MGVPSSSGTTFTAKDKLLNHAEESVAAMKSQAQELHDDSASGNVGANKILDFLVRLDGLKKQYDKLATVSGIAAFAKTHYDDAALEIVTEYATFNTAMVSLGDWIVSNFPGDAGGFHEKKFVGWLPTINQWTPAQTSTLRLELLAFIATID